MDAGLFFGAVSAFVLASVNDVGAGLVLGLCVFAGEYLATYWLAGALPFGSPGRPPVVDCFVVVAVSNGGV